jgi:hypothetical protein
MGLKKVAGLLQKTEAGIALCTQSDPPETLPHFTQTKSPRPSKELIQNICRLKSARCG